MLNATLRSRSNSQGKEGSLKNRCDGVVDVEWVLGMLLEWRRSSSIGVEKTTTSGSWAKGVAVRGFSGREDVGVLTK